MTDLIKRADAIDAMCSNCLDRDVCTSIVGTCESAKAVAELPSADADGEDLIIKGAKGIQDGLYNIKDGKLFKYKGKGGTVRTYPIVSAEAVHGKWIPIEETLPTYDGGEKTWITGMKCSNCGKLFDLRVGYHYCPSCGARMKGGAE